MFISASIFYARRSFGFRNIFLTAIVLVSGMTPAYVSAEDAKLPGYIGTEVCGNCHQDAMADWAPSHHAKAWTLPGSETVLADFNDTSFSHQGVQYRFETKAGAYFVEVKEPDGTSTRYPVVGVAGVAPLQQYLLETAPGQIQSFDVVWDVDRKEWYHLYPDQDLPVGDGLHWGGHYKNWNARCAECHATGFEKNFDAQSKTYASTQEEIGVGCEACHGPGEAHQEWALANDNYDLAKWANLTAKGFTMDFKAGPEAEIQQCASCHARREPFEAGNPMPGAPFHDTYRLSALRPGLYHADGQILDEVYVYGSFLQSRMYANGVACTDCHNPHSAERVAEGNAVCTQCHNPGGNSRFPSLKLAEYDDPKHHFHPEGGEGAQCKSCHMIERDYMGVDGRRDHSFRVPRPDLTIETGSPNACNDCHDDKTAGWASQTVTKWYPDSRHRGAHFSQVFAPARNNPGDNIDGLIGIVEHTGLPAIVRASALDLLAQVSTPAIADRIAPSLSDPDPVVRAAAIPVQREAGQVEKPTRLVPLLDDPVRSVRIAAAREFLGMRIARLPDRVTKSLNTAMTEWQRSLHNKADFPETQLVLAGIGLTTRNMNAALSAFGDAVEMDPQLVQAWTMMVRIHAALGDRQAALDTVAAAIEANPDDISLNLMQADLKQ